MKLRIAKGIVDKLQIGQRSVSDSEVRGFQARRLPSGTVAFDYRYTPLGGGLVLGQQLGRRSPARLVLEVVCFRE